MAPTANSGWELGCHLRDRIEPRRLRLWTVYPPRPVAIDSCVAAAVAVVIARHRNIGRDTEPDRDRRMVRATNSPGPVRGTKDRGIVASVTIVIARHQAICRQPLVDGRNNVVRTRLRD